MVRAKLVTPSVIFKCKSTEIYKCEKIAANRLRENSIEYMKMQRAMMQKLTPQVRWFTKKEERVGMARLSTCLRKITAMPIVTRESHTH
jgi:hypothetical protein